MLKIILVILSIFFTGAGLRAQTEVTVSTQPNYTTQVWYALENGNMSEKPLMDWDLGFEISGFTSSILLNTASGNIVFLYPGNVAGETAFTNLDTAGINGWTTLYNSDTSWSYGAFNQSMVNEYDLGWGIYDPVTHIVTGDSLYVVKLADGSFKKLWIKDLNAGIYNFRFASLDNSNDITATLKKSDFTGKNFGYFSLLNNEQINPEPLSADWDLLFSKYTTFIPMPDLTPYGVTGILANKGVTIAKAQGVDINSDDYTGQIFTSEINTIGYDWKTYDFGTNTYLIEEDLVYFIAKNNGEIWKLIFTGFGGSSNGEYYFTQEQISTGTSVYEDNITTGFGIHPNITLNDHITLVLYLNENISSAQCTITDLNGRLIYIDALKNLVHGINQKNILLDHLEPGMYFVNISFNGKTLSQKLIRQ